MPKNNGKNKDKQQSKKKVAKPTKKVESKNSTPSEHTKSKLTISSQTNESQDVNCESCNKTKEEGQWLVQCDDCQKYFHFECVGIVSIGEKDPWSCTGCIKNKNKSAYLPPRNPLNPNYAKGKLEQDLKCDSCGETSKEWRRYVQCDVCDKIYHFECAGITELYEEDFWSCIECNKANNISQVEFQQSQNASSANKTSVVEPRPPTKIVAQADVHAVHIPTIVDLSEDSDDSWLTVTSSAKQQAQTVDRSKIESVNDTFDENHLNVKRTSTRAPSLNPHFKSKTVTQKTRTNSVNTISSTASQRLERVQAELALQKQIDTEMLDAMRSRMDAEADIRLEKVRVAEALKLKELEMREKRERKLLETQAKARSSQGGSVRSASTNATSRTSYVSNWIENQSKRPNVNKNHQEKVNVQPIINKATNPTVTMKSNSVVENEQPKTKFVSRKDKSVDERVQHHKTRNNEIEWSISVSEAEKKQAINFLKSTRTNDETIKQPSNVQSKELNVNVLPYQYSQNETYVAKSVSSSQPFVNTKPKSVKITSRNANMGPSIQGQDTRNWQRQIQSTQVPQTSGASVTFSRASNNQRSHQSENSRAKRPSNPNNQHGQPMGNEEEIYSMSDTDEESDFQASSNQARSNQVRSIENNQEMVNASKLYSSANQVGNLRPGHPTLTAEQIATRHVMGRAPLPLFNGDPADWLRFITKYESATANCGFSNVENLERLDKSIQKPARDLIEAQLTIPECVPEIIDTLRQKYGRPEIIIRTVLAKIRSEPAIRPDRMEALSNYGYKVRNVRNTIESLKMYYHLHNPELLQDLVDKLPHQTKIDWARHSESIQNISLIHLSDWLYRLSKSLNRIATFEIKSTFNDRKPDRKPEDSHMKAVGYVNVHDNNNSSKFIKDEQHLKVKKCVICESDCKFAGECPKFKGLTVEERWNSMVENKLCRRCLRRHGGNCRNFKVCGENGCTFKHHSLLHNDKKVSKEKSPKQSANNDAKSTVAANMVVGGAHTHYDNDEETMFRIVPVELYNNGKSVRTFAFLDEGSSFTLLERSLAERIELRGTPEMICLLWTNNINRVERSEVANLEISGTHETPSTRYPLNSVHVVDTIYLPTQTLNSKELVQGFRHLSSLPLPEVKDVKPTMIIGLKHARLSTPLQTIEGEGDDPIATRCRLGWSIHGPKGDSNIGYVNVHRVVQCSCQDRDDYLHDMIKEHFTVENFGVTTSSMSLHSKENELAMELLKKFTIRKGSRFETRLLWKNEACELPDSYPMAIKRLKCLENKGPNVITTINDFINDYVEKGYVSKLSPNEIARKHSRTWYLPLFTVVHPKKPEKLRPVFDGAAKVNGTSLNSSLFTGPDLLTSIVDVLRRFREHKIAFSGDIKEMFHQVAVHEEDRNSQRFIWRNGDQNRVPDVYVMNVMTFGSTCSPSAAQFVKNTNAAEYKKRFPRAAEAIIKNHYVDDLMDGAENVHDSVQLINEVKFIHRKAGFEIRNFKSNSMELLKAIGEQVNFDENVSVENESMIERVLGMFWNTRTDCFTFLLKFTKVTTEILSGRQLPTKREALRLLMSIFDPLGLLSYYLIHLKILIQDVWRSQAKWDDQISEDLKENWIRWVKILPNVTKLNIPRCYSFNLSANVKKVEMHIFVDAGEEAFAAVAYLKIETKESCECSLVGSKARVAPLKHLSIPRLELQAAVLGSRLLTSVSNSQTFKIDRRIIWSDSETVLSWLKSNSRKYSQFVAHRVGEVLENTNVNEWRWVPSKHIYDKKKKKKKKKKSKQNIADEATKWSKIPTFDVSNRWFKGPDFILQSEDKWPIKKIIKSNVKEEMRPQFAHARFILPKWIDPGRFSKFDRMVRALAYAIRMLQWKSLTARIKSEPLTQEELIKAESLVFRQAQFEGFPSEMATLERNKTLPIDKYEFIERPSILYDGSPFLDKYGVLRMKWRIDSARELSYDNRRPIVLPNEGRTTDLLVHSYHVKYYHQNHETVFNELRQRFYIPRLRSVIRRVRKECQMCKAKMAAVMEPQMADLPQARLAINFRPFSFVGIDYFGPYYVKIGKRKEKRWGVLFTCLTIRAVHIELAPSLDTNECIICIRNFITIHGTPIEIHSDNGSNLRGADSELERERQKINDAELSEKFTSSYTKWIFTAPKAAHMGGAWERLIRCVKSGLDEIMPTRTPNESMLRNLLLEAANVVNSRPLTYIPLETSEDEALTPNHFLLGSSNGYKPPCKLDLDGPYLRKCWKESQRLTELFWKRFTKEYLPTITRRTKWFKRVKPLERGDLVLVVDPDNPRNTYPKARIVETQMGSNNQVRRAKVEFILEAKTDTYGKICKIRRKALWRPANKLAVIDVTPKVDPKGAIAEVQPSVNQIPAHKKGLAHPTMDRKTGGSVGASGEKNSKLVDVAKNKTHVSSNASSSRILRSAVRK